VRGDAVRSSYDKSREVLAGLARLGIDLDEVTALLEREGVEKFVTSWDEMLATVQEALDAAR